jgi:hypothetical protein
METLASYDARISSLEQDITRMEKELHALKISRNARASLVSLPDELLLHVARFVTPHPIFMESPENLYKLTWICHRLRFLCVGARELWAVVNMSDWGLRSIRNFLDRSAPLPLNIQATSRDGMAGEGLTLLTRGLARAWRLDLFISDGSLHWQELLQQNNTVMDCHLLRDLVIESTGPLESLLSWFSYNHLVTLHINGLQHNDILPNVPALQFLHLSHTWYTLDMCYTFLCKTPQLERIKLEHALDRSSIVSQGHGTKHTRGLLQLPHLSDLIIIDYAYCVDALLDILPDPASCFEVHLTSNRNSTWLSVPNANALSRLEAFRQKRHRSEETLLSTAHVLFTVRGAQHITVRSQREFISYSHAFSTITEEEALDGVKTLHVNGVMTTLDLTVQRLSACLGPRCLPKLEQLVITRVVGNAHQDAGGATQELQDWMALRQQEGFPIQSVAFVECDDTARPLINELVRSQSVRSVTWDGEEKM